MHENLEKLHQEFKELKVKAEKRVQAIEKLKHKFLEEIKSLSNSDFISVELILATYKHDIKNC